jgi:hypothetical protein
VRALRWQRVGSELMPNPLASALTGLAAACDARGWRLRIAYGPGRPAWTANVYALGDVPDYFWGAGETLAAALDDVWKQVQRWCREQAATGRARRAEA